MIAILFALACLPVDGPKLLARHFAAAVAEFAQLAPETGLGYAPLPGVVRVIRAGELQTIASKNGLTLAEPANGVCFEWPMKPIDPEHAAEAMRKALPADTRLEVLELSHAPVPEGDVEFPLDRLQGNIWRGVVRYSKTGHFDVWARVKIQKKQVRLVTLAPLRTGEAISAAQLRAEEFEDTPVASLVTSLEEAVGLVTRRALPSGSILKTEYLDRPPVISKGDTVRLRTSIGVANVVAEASAQAPGKIGDVIPVKNASSGRVLRARIEAPGEVRLTQ